MEFISLAQLGRDVLEWHRQLPNDIDSLYGIPRSGKLVAVLLSEYMGKAMASGENCLIVDDSLLSGRTMLKAKQCWPGYSTGAAVYVKPGNEKCVDYFYKVVPTPRLFEWQLWRHPFLSKCMVDIDGVLCPDPPIGDERLLLETLSSIESFYRDVEPIVVPQQRIGTLVTGRLERYRRLTEEWLNKWGIRYTQLRMRPRNSLRHKHFKAPLYAASKAPLLIESSPRVARQVFAMTGRPVLCWKTRTLLK